MLHWALVEREEWQSWPGLLSGLVSHLCSHQAAGFANVLPQVPSPETLRFLRADR